MRSPALRRALRGFVVLLAGQELALGLALREQRRWLGVHACPWELVPILVASDRLPAGSVLAWDGLVQRAVPPQLVTPDVLRPGDARLAVGLRLSQALEPGDPVRLASLGLD